MSNSNQGREKNSYFEAHIVRIKCGKLKVYLTIPVPRSIFIEKLKKP